MFSQSEIEASMHYGGLNINMRPLHAVTEKVVKSLLEKFGRSETQRLIISEEDSEVNQVLTWLVELGALKYVNDNAIQPYDERSLKIPVLAASVAYNIALGNVLRKNGLKEDPDGMYFSNDANDFLAERTYNHYLKLNDSQRKKLPISDQQDQFTIDEIFDFYLNKYL